MKNSDSKRIKVLQAKVLWGLCFIACLWLLTDFGFIHSSSAAQGVPVTESALEGKMANTKKLIGRWLREDAPYVIEIKQINNNGTVEAGYYNPKPINIAQATVSLEKAAIKVFIELRDKGYPGSTYTLDYSPIPDVLNGTYFHVGLNRRFPVSFTRDKQQNK